MQQKTTKTDSLVPYIEMMQGRIMDWNIIWIGRGERVKGLKPLYVCNPQPLGCCE